MVRNSINGGSDAQPGAKLTNEQWEALWAEYLIDRTVSVTTLCRKRSISRARFYAKFKSRIDALKENAPVHTTDAGQAGADPGLASSVDDQKEAA